MFLHAKRRYMNNIELVSKFSGIKVDDLTSNNGDNDWFFWCESREFEVLNGKVVEV